MASRRARLHASTKHEVRAGDGAARSGFSFERPPRKGRSHLSAAASATAEALVAAVDVVAGVVSA